MLISGGATFRKILCLLPALLFFYNARAEDIVHFRLSKPYCLLNFLSTCNGDPNASQGLSAFIARKGLLQDTAFQKILAVYRTIPLEYHYSREQFPEHRLRSRYGNTLDLLVIAAVQSGDLRQFREKVIGILPNADYEQLCSTLEAALPYYDRLIWKPYYPQLAATLNRLKTYEPQASRLFTLLNHFYAGSWNSDIPFTVTLYPVPGRRVGTAATPHVNALCVGVRTDDSDYDGIAGVVLHEMCHSLYNEQAAAVQQQQERYFTGDTSRYSSVAYSYIDEGLATACGNGWARESFSGRPDTGEWYHNDYINGFGHALYPMVKEYLTADRSIDSDFIARAIRLFAGLFPKAPYDYDLLLSSINLYSDAATAEERAGIYAALNKQFKVLSFNSSSPILDPTSLEMIAHTATTQVVIIQKNAEANLQALRKLFPQLSAILKGRHDTDYVVSFYDSDRRPVIIIRALSTKGLETALAFLHVQRFLDPTRAYYPM